MCQTIAEKEICHLIPAVFFIYHHWGASQPGCREPLFRLYKQGSLKRRRHRLDPWLPVCDGSLEETLSWGNKQLHWWQTARSWCPYLRKHLRPFLMPSILIRCEWRASSTSHLQIKLGTRDGKYRCRCQIVANNMAALSFRDSTRRPGVLQPSDD